MAPPWDLHESEVAQMVDSEISQPPLEVDRRGMERCRLVVPDRLHLALDGVQGENLGIQASDEGCVHDRRVARVHVEARRDGHEPGPASAIARSAQLFDERSVNVDEVRVDEVAGAAREFVLRYECGKTHPRNCCRSSSICCKFW